MKKYIEKERLRTVTNYAKDIGKSRQAVYAMINRGTIKHIVIDNVIFIIK